MAVHGDGRSRPAAVFHFFGKSDLMDQREVFFGLGNIGETHAIRRVCCM
jgi:hypothetical protein